MKFDVGAVKEKECVRLQHDSWNDWFQYETTYNVYYYDKDENEYRLGRIKIGKKDLKDGIPELPSSFEALSEEYFSIGFSIVFYMEFNTFINETEINGFREAFFKGLNDMAYNTDIFDTYKSEEVTNISLLREYSVRSIKGQINRIARGGAPLSSYEFEYPLTIDGDSLTFKVKPKSNPSTNVHVLIGKNGVGKTTLLMNMIKWFFSKDTENNGEFKKEIVNLVYISFSVFDDFSTFDNLVKKESGDLPFERIGVLTNDGKIKTNKDFAKEFYISFRKFENTDKHTLWQQMIDILTCGDYSFQDLDVRNWKTETTLNAEAQEDPLLSSFSSLSSGHKIVLLTITKLIELVSEKTLIIMDEPEQYLHPPLLSSFIRCLSELLIFKNGLAIIATHSPIVLQEVPKQCVWMLRRYGDNDICAVRLKNETFGENIGTLISEVFGYEVTRSGFYTVLKDVADKYKNYDKAIEQFDNQLGFEAKSILKGYIYAKEQEDDQT